MRSKLPRRRGPVQSRQRCRPRERREGRCRRGTRADARASPEEPTVNVLTAVAPAPTISELSASKIGDNESFEDYLKHRSDSSDLVSEAWYEQQPAQIKVHRRFRLHALNSFYRHYVNQKQEEAHHGRKTAGGKAAIVTGAGIPIGIGHAIALGLVRAGARVALTDINHEWLDQSVNDAREIGGDDCAISIVSDVTDSQSCQDAVDTAIAQLEGQTSP